MSRRGPKMSLIEASSKGNLPIVNQILQEGRQDVNACDRAGYTALMEAAARGHTEVVRLLLEKGADRSLRTPWNETALNLARQEGHPGVIALLSAPVKTSQRQEPQQRKVGLQAQVAQLKLEVSEREKFKLEIEKLHRQLEQQRLQHRREGEELRTKVAGLQQELSRQHRQMAALQDRASEAERRAQAAESREREVAVTFSSQREQMTILQQRVSEAERRARAAEEQVRIAEAMRNSPPREDQESWLLRQDDIEFIEELGRGGWATVRLAKLQVAAKCLHSVIVSDYNRELFVREMTIAARVRHPNLVLFLGATMDDEPTILMEKMSTTLRAQLERQPLTPQQITSVSLDVAQALNYLHEMQPDPIIHRDVSSANVLLNPSRVEGSWIAKVSDYGSAKLLSRLTTANPGNPVYAAPEAEFPTRQSAKMDVYSYGVLLLEIATRRFPDPDNRQDVIPTVTHPQMAALIPQCVQREPQQRPTMRAILRQFQ